MTYNRDKIIQTLHNIVDEAKDIEPYVIVAQPKRKAEETCIQSFNPYGLCHVAFTGYSFGYIDCIGQKIDVARNYLIEKALETNAKYLFFIGDDTALPYNAFATLHATAEANPNSVVCGVYYMKAGEPMIDVRVGNHVKVANCDLGQVFEAWQTGMDCMLIPIQVLRDMYDPELPYCCVANGIEDIPFIGEDNFFVHRLRQAGVKLLVDTNVQCLHVDMFTGKWTGHESIDPDAYFTNVELKERLTVADKGRLDKIWHERIPD